MNMVKYIHDRMGLQESWNLKQLWFYLNSERFFLWKRGQIGGSKHDSKKYQPTENILWLVWGRRGWGPCKLDLWVWGCPRVLRIIRRSLSSDLDTTLRPCHWEKSQRCLTTASQNPCNIVSLQWNHLYNSLKERMKSELLWHRTQETDGLSPWQPNLFMPSFLIYKTRIIIVPIL